ncbi:SlyX family protein [Hyphobacterium marinum]|uniref:SlyX family protein n=1 Tax=Hyphobacterium marinum TaxID=3116574 RepID=A0ABU7M0U9_9PROT|nr:SlyX family protein [Hyphobacterium sp. Y6023]MEE2567152.1 SlyX family protein [Hyphobacterium sp. Y6023]
MTPETRLTNLESHVAEQARMLEELSDVIARQQREIDRLTARLEASADRIGALEAQAPPPASEKPPHW